MLACCWHPGLDGGPMIDWNTWHEMDVDDRDYLVTEISRIREEISSKMKSRSRSR